MVQKRPFDEEFYEVSSKQPRHLEVNNLLVSALEFPCGPVTDNLGEDGEKFSAGTEAEPPGCDKKSVVSIIPGSVSCSSWPTSSTSEEDIRLEAPSHILLSPDYRDVEHPPRTTSHSREIYSFSLRYPPRKLVPLGPDFQAEILHCSEKQSKTAYDESPDSSSQPSKSNLSDHFDDESFLAGTCIFAMPESEPSANEKRVGSGRTDCLCEDLGSIRCVRQHIMEARERLKRDLGEKTFFKLGFYDMGELVAEGWSEEEEQIFHEVVFSNPVSLGKNFWDHLAKELPCRTKQEIVSYYFNVFMLRRRAEQNRNARLNIDSDDDEWQGTDGFANEEVDMTDEDEDSAVESPVNEDTGCNEVLRDNMHKHDEDLTHAHVGAYKHLDIGSHRVVTDLLRCDNGSSSLKNLPTDGGISKEIGVLDVGDGSCTSDDTWAAPRAPPREADNGKTWKSNFGILSSGVGNDGILGHCTAKEWDVGYLGCPKTEVDFLPTRSVIEEVFGAEPWSHDPVDGEGSS